MTGFKQMIERNQLPLTAAALTRGLSRVNNLEWLGVNAEHQAIWRVDTDRLLVITAHTGGLDVSGLPRSLFRFQLGETQGADYNLLPDLSAPIALTSLVYNDKWLLQSGNAELEIKAQPLRFTLRHQGKTILTSTLDEHFRGWSRLPSFAVSENRQLFALELAADEPVYGLGEKFSALNRRGQLMVGRNEDALGVNAERSYKNIPFAWSPTGWGILVHTPATVTHGVGFAPWSHRSYVVDIEDDSLDLFLFAADKPAELLADYQAITGKAEPVPLWSLGTWISRAYYRTPEDALDVAKQWRAKKLPGEVLTLDGRACWEVATRFSFIWDETRYPDPVSSLSKLKNQGFKICVWEYPLVAVDGPLFADFASRNWLLRNQQGAAYQYHWVDPKEADESPFGDVLTPLPVSGIVDLTHPDAYAWWRDQHEALFAAGVDVIKADFGEQVPDDAIAWNGDTGARLHNVYALLYHRCVYEATQKFKANETLIWARDGFIGSQRYPIQWGGDPQSDWGGLAASIRGMLGYGLSGVPYYSSDIGGFYGANQPSPDLYLRWLAHGVFSSHCRLHGIGAREPWIFGEPYQQISKHWLNLRYRLLPYLQGVIDNAVQNSLPVAQAMPLAFPEDPVSWAYENQYLFGPALLVRPIITASDRVSVWLPQGSRWFDFWSTDVYEGGQLIEIKAGLDRIPVFGREGHVLVLGPEVETTAQINPHQPINELWLFGKTTEQPLVMNNVISLEAAGVINVDSGTVLRLRSWGSSWTRKVDSLRYDEPAYDEPDDAKYKEIK
jgi:Alpha-glucosidases, family 31 of glycosyl hydrolases